MGEDRPVRKQPGLWLWLLGGLGSTGLALLVIFGVAVAVLGATFTGCETGTEPAAASNGPEPSAYARQNIPPKRLSLYEKAGAKFDIDWSFLASIGTQECGTTGTCAGTNSAGCAGPMQIAYERGSECSPGSEPTLWERYGVSAHPGHAPDVNNLADAIYTAARILREDKSAPPVGGTYAQYRQAACGYYGACSYAGVNYADEVMARAVQYGFTGTGTPAATNPTLAEPAATTGCQASSLLPGAASGSRIVRIAESQVGQGEHPQGSNCTMYGPCVEWCSLFVAWVWQHAGVPLPGSTALYGYSGSLYTWVIEHGGRVLPQSATPSPGDAVFYGTGPSSSVHVGIVKQVYPNGEITTIEGNYANRVTLLGPFPPAHATSAGETGPIYGYAQPPAPKG